MANENKIRIGSTTPTAILLDRASGVDNFDLKEGIWEINNGWEIEFVSSRFIKIKKFKIDTWGIRLRINPSGEDGNRARKYQVYVKGLTDVNTRVQFTKAYCGTAGYDADWKAGKYNSGRYIQGLGIQGGYRNSNNSINGLQMAMHPWDIGDVSNISDGYVIGSNFDGSFYALTIGLFGGVQDSTSADYEKVWDISDIPIIIDIKANHINPASKECFKLKSNNLDLYHKPKTFENCWKKYGIVKVRNYEGIDINVISPENIGVKNSIYLPELDTLDIPQNIAWQLDIYNSNYWDTIKNWYLTHEIPGELLHGELFKNCGMSGELTLNINDGPNIWGHDLFRNSKITKVNFNFTNNARITSCNTIFRGASSLTEVTTNSKFSANDLSGMFEWASALVVSPKGIIEWRDTGFNDNTNIGYCWDGCKSMTTIEQETNNRDDAENTIIFSRFAPQVFYACAKLETIGPVLDLMRVDPSNGDNTYYMFTGCSVLTDVRIKNLNHGDWRLDGTGNLGNLSTINQDSVIYLFSNLVDLINNYSSSIEDDDLTTSKVNSANLYCPNEWASYITNSMIQAANAKGWTIYVGGSKVTAN